MKRLQRRDIEDILPLTPMQLGMLYHYLENPRSNIHLEQLYVEFSGKIEPSIFQRAWDRVIADNEMLRTVLRWDDVKEPAQIVLKRHRFKPGYHDFSHRSGDEKRELLEQVKNKDRHQTFDLHQVPFRVTLCRIGESRCGLLVTSHHILYDGWSSGIILKEFFHTYTDLSQHRVPTAPAKGKFKDFIRWLRSRDTEAFKQQRESFWKEYLQGAAGTHPHEVPQYPAGRKKSVKDVETYGFKFQPGLKSEIDRFIKSRKISLSSLLYAAWGLLLQGYQNSRDVVFDTTVSGRSAKVTGIENMVGLFINTLPLRVKTHDRQIITSLLAGLHDGIRRRQAFENTSLFFLNVYLEDHRAGVPFDSLVVLENYPLDIQSIEKKCGFSFHSFTGFGTNNYDLTVIITLFDTVAVNFIYNRRLFTVEAVREMSRHFINIVKNIIGNPGNTVAELRIVPEKIPAKGKEDFPAEPVPDYTAPRTGTERKLVEIWRRVLGRQEIGIDDNFFDYGGHSLKASLLAVEIHRAFHIKVPLARVFSHPTIKELARCIALFSRADSDNHPAIEPVEKKEYYRLSLSQKRLYMIRQLDPKGTAYNGQLVLGLEGRIRGDRFEGAIRKLIRRHESLRTSFITVNDQPVQEVHHGDDVKFEIEFYNPGNREDRMPGLIKDFIRPFDLSKAPLLRVGLITSAKNRSIFIIDMHHIITDGISVDILMREFAAFYNREKLSPPRIQYKDFSGWQLRRLSWGMLKQQEAYWRDLFSGEPPVLNMPTDFSRPPRQSFRGDRVSFELDNQLSRGLGVLTRNSGTTLYMVLLAVYSIVLSRYSGQEDIIVGTPAAGRNHTNLENIVGFFLETLAIPTQPRGDKTAGQFLKEVKTTVLNAYENQDYPFDELIKRVWKSNDLSRNPLFDVMLNVPNRNHSQMKIQGLTITPYNFTREISKVDLTLEAKKIGHRVNLELEYCTALFARETIGRFSRHLVNTARQVANNPCIRLSAVEMMAEAEKRQLLETFNNTAVKYTGTKAVHELFAGQVEKTPDHTALSGKKVSSAYYAVSITYKELNRQSNQLAHLLEEKGVGPDTIVGIVVEPSLELVIGIWGILKSGGAYLPIDPGYPEERINYMLADSGANVLLKSTSITVLDFEHLNFEFVSCSEFRAADLNPANAAYIIYTSGTTGRPKGVMVDHGNLAAYIDAFEQEFDVGKDDIVIQQVSYAFDAFVEEFYPIQLKGGKLAIPGRQVIRDIHALCGFIARHRVTFITCSPQLLNELNNFPGSLASLRLLISGGDRLKAEYIDNLLEAGKVYNTYGPTETTVCATYYRCPAPGDLPPHVPIGKPIANYRVYILNGYGNLLPVGAAGELCVAGGGVTRGYLNKPELTAEKFNYDKKNKSFCRGARRKLYKTGDLARWLPTGIIQFLGRSDRQVKIRGYRVEPAEIESHLLAVEGIKQVLLVLKTNKKEEPYLCAYFTGRPRYDTPALREHLLEVLPLYMVPTYFVQLERFPSDSNARVDIKALPEPVIGTSPGYAPPGSEIEKQLVMIWSEVLGIDEGLIGIDAGFFELGGQSLMAMKLISLLREKFTVKIPLETFFQSGTIKQMARLIRESRLDPGNKTTAADVSSSALKFIKKERREIEI